MKTDVIEAEVITTGQLIQEGISKGVNLTELKEILKLREIDDAFKAKKAFAKYFSIAQANIESVIKTRVNSQTHSKYAELGDVIETAKPAYTKEGFSMIFYEGDCPKENHVRIFVDILHCEGHMETKHYDVPMDGKGLRGNDNMTAIHGKASSVSYGRRYLMCMIWNIPTSDNDVNTKTVTFIGKKELMAIRDCLIAKELSEQGLLKVLKIDSLEELPLTRYNEALGIIAAKVKSTEVK